MQLHQFFDLKSPSDLLRKLEREYGRWKADPLNADFAWNFFVTAEHLPDWMYYQGLCCKNSWEYEERLVRLPYAANPNS